MFTPKLISIIKNKKSEFTKKQLLQDLISGIIVAIIALPLSLALAIASGVSPEKGIITAIIGGFIISFLGGSRVQIGGPTGAFVIIIYGIIQEFGLKGLAIATIMAGIFLVVFGLLRFGSVIKYIPFSITTGFTVGIALVLLTTQIKDFLGLKIEDVPAEFIGKWEVYFKNINTLSLATLLIGVLAIAIIVLVPKISKRIPGALIAIIVTTLLVEFLNLPVETIGSRFGEISSNISMADFSGINIETISKLINPAITIAILAGVESLLSAVVADGMIGKKHNSNVELIAQGIANIFCALFGGIPATGAVARTAANVKNGGRTPVAGIVHSAFLLVIMLTLMPLAKLIPMTTLAAILFVVAYNMSEIGTVKEIFGSTKSDIIIMITTFLLTVIFDLVVAIEIGMIIAMFLFVKKSSDITYAKKLELDQEEEETDFKNDKITVYEIRGPLFFGAANTFMDIINEVNINAEILIIKMKHVPVLDATAINTLKRMKKQCKKKKIKLLFAEVQQKPMKLLEKSGFVDDLGEENFFTKTEEAINYATRSV